MNDTRINKLMNYLLALSTVAILVGAFFKIQHYPYGDSIFWSGIVANIILKSYEISRLKKIIAKSNRITPEEMTL